MNLDKSHVDMGDLLWHPEWFNLSPHTVELIHKFEEWHECEIRIHLHGDGCNQAATLTKKTPMGEISYFYRFCCGELYVDIDGNIEYPGEKFRVFKTLDEFALTVLGFQQRGVVPV